MQSSRWTWTLILAIAVVAPNAICHGQAAKEEKELYSTTADAHVEIKEAMEKAAASHKRVVVVFGANWCFDCHVLDKDFHRPDMAAIIAANYELVHVDIGIPERPDRGDRRASDRLAGEQWRAPALWRRARRPPDHSRHPSQPRGSRAHRW